MKDKEALELIKKQFSENLKDGLLNLQVAWLIEQAGKVGQYEEVLQQIASGKKGNMDVNRIWLMRMAQTVLGNSQTEK